MIAHSYKELEPIQQIKSVLLCNANKMCISVWLQWPENLLVNTCYILNTASNEPNLELSKMSLSPNQCIGVGAVPNTFLQNTANLKME